MEADLELGNEMLLAALGLLQEIAPTSFFQQFAQNKEIKEALSQEFKESEKQITEAQDILDYQCLSLHQFSKQLLQYIPQEETQRALNSSTNSYAPSLLEIQADQDNISMENYAKGAPVKSKTLCTQRAPPYCQNPFLNSVNIQFNLQASMAHNVTASQKNQRRILEIQICSCRQEIDTKRRQLNLLNEQIAQRRQILSGLKQNNSKIIRQHKSQEQNNLTNTCDKQQLYDKLQFYQKQILNAKTTIQQLAIEQNLRTKATSIHLDQQIGNLFSDVIKKLALTVSQAAKQRRLQIAEHTQDNVFDKGKISEQINHLLSTKASLDKELEQTKITYRTLAAQLRNNM